MGSGNCFNRHFWYTGLRSNNDYPHAPWWHTEKDGPWNGDDYNPTVALAGFIVRFADKESTLYETGCRIVKEAYDQLVFGSHKYDMHTIVCYIQIYICKPSQFFNSSDNIFYQDNKEIADYEFDFILNSQLEDGSYIVPWDWMDYPEEWAVSKMWWKSEMIIKNLLYLKGMEEVNGI